MTLFDDLDRKDVGSKQWSEPTFEFLNRSARPVAGEIRALLDAWFREYPCTHAADLRGRFRNRDDQQHHGALFELYLHALLTRMGCSVEPHPTLDDSPNSPDFLIESPKGHSFYLEATVCTDSITVDPAVQSRIRVLWDTLDRIPSKDFAFSVYVSGSPSAPIRGRRIRTRIEAELPHLDREKVIQRYSEGGWSNLPLWRFREANATIEVRAIPLREGAIRGDRAVGVRSGPVARIATDQSIRRALGAKGGKKYGRRELPLVIAINTLAEFSPDDFDLMNALFGQESVTEWMGTDGRTHAREARSPSGFWHGPRGAQNTRVSAVLAFCGLDSYTVANHVPAVWHNPWATRPYACELTALPQRRQQGDRMALLEGESPNAWFGLPVHWPEPAP